MGHQLEALRDIGVRDIVVVIGHLGFEVVRALGDGSNYGVRIRYVEQGATLGIAHAVSRLEQKIDRPFYLFLGDIFFEMAKLGALAEAVTPGKCDGALAVKREPDAEQIKRNFVVHADKGLGPARDREAAPPAHRSEGLRPLFLR